MPHQELQGLNHLCDVPQNIEFEFVPEQLLHATLLLTNLTHRIIHFEVNKLDLHFLISLNFGANTLSEEIKIKTNNASEYLVRPSEGQICEKGISKIRLSRKELEFHEFHKKQYQNNKNKSQNEGFLVEIACSTRNAMGREKIETEQHYVSVHFVVKGGATPQYYPYLTNSKNSEKKQEIESVKMSIKNLQQEKEELEKIAVNKKDKAKINERELKILSLLAFIIGMIVAS